MKIINFLFLANTFFPDCEVKKTDYIIFSPPPTPRHILPDPLFSLSTKGLSFASATCFLSSCILQLTFLFDFLNKFFHISESWF